MNNPNTTPSEHLTDRDLAEHLRRNLEHSDRQFGVQSLDALIREAIRRLEARSTR